MFSEYFIKSYRNSWNIKGWRQSKAWVYITEAGMIHFHKNNKCGADLDRQLIIAQLHAMDQKVHPAVLPFLCMITTTRSTTSAIRFLYSLYVSKKLPDFFLHNAKLDGKEKK